MENFALIFVALIIGYLINLKALFPHNAPIILNQFILYISLPAMILLQIPRLSFSYEILIPVGVAWVVMTVSALVIFYLAKLFNFSREITGALMLVGVLGNTSFVGIPLTQAYFGDSALPYVLMYDQLGSFIALSTYGTFVSIYYSSETKIDIKAIALKILTFPAFLTLLVSLFFIGRSFDPLIISVLSNLANTIVPLALVSVGLQLRFKLPKEERKAFYTALGVKIVLSPLIAFGVCYIFGWEGIIADVSVIEAAMGPMITAGAVASMAGLAPRLSSAIIGYGIILSLFSTSIVLKLIS